MIPCDPPPATGEGSADANVHEEPREPIGVTETRTSSTLGLQTVSGPHTIVAQSPPPPPALRDSIASGLEAVSPAEEQKMPPGAGSEPGFAAMPPPRPQQHWAGMIPWDKEAEQQKTVVEHVDGNTKSKKRRRGRWVWAFGIVVLLVLITALGLGLGLSMRYKREKNLEGSGRPGAASDSTSSSPTASTAPSPTPLDTAPLCPGANNTITDDGSGMQYRRICGISYDGNDIQPQKAETMGQCLALCSGHTGGSACTGVVWYDAGPQGTDLNWCWLKRSMDKAVLSYRDAAQTAIRI